MARRIEFLVLFVFSPLPVWFGWLGGAWVMPLLAAGAVYGLAVALAVGPPASDLGLGRSTRAAGRRGLCEGVVVWAACLAAALAVHAVLGRRLLPDPIDRPGFFLFLAIVYPLSALAQEFLFRSFYFWRYRGLASPRVLAVVNVAVFAWVHVMLGAWQTVAASLVGGVLFTAMYLRHTSLWAVSVFHTLMGLSLFALGYTDLFFRGSASAAAAIERWTGM